MSAFENQQFPCLSCGSNLHYLPGSTQMRCVHCSELYEIEESQHDDVAELDFYSTLKDIENSQAPNTTHEATVIECQQCAATFPFKKNHHAGSCPYCGTHIVANTKQQRQITPWGMLPFKIDSDKAWKEYKTWLTKLWFAPNALKKYAKTHQQLNGMYVPYWTYDSKTSSQYVGQRGTYYQVPVTVPTQVNGRTVMKTKMITKVRWQHVSGHVNLFFDDVLVYASRTLPKSMAKELEPWDLHELIPYQSEYISGFNSEYYQVGLQDGFNEMKERIRPEIHRAIARDIGGDAQRIIKVQTTHDNIRFRHVLLPFWTAGFRYNRKTYQFIVNGRTGEVQGERPYSAIKIGLLVIFIAGLVGLGVWLLAENPEILEWMLRFLTY